MTASQRDKSIECKYCGRNMVVKCGSYKGIPRYLCKSCGRKFKDDNHVFRMSVPVEYIDRVLNLHYEGMRINEIRNYLQWEFGYYPSATLIHFWIDKYTSMARQMIKNYHPQVGRTWVVDEMRVRMGGKIFWLYDVTDDKTDFLLASFIIRARNKGVLKLLVQMASEVSRKVPKIVMVYMPRASFDAMEKGSGYVSEHVPREIFADNHRIGILRSTNVNRMRSLKYLRTLKTANDFFNGLSVHYNYFSSNTKINGETPAEAAQIEYPFHSWKDLVGQSSGLRTSLLISP